MSGQVRYLYGTRCEALLGERPQLQPKYVTALEQEVIDLRRRIDELEHSRIASQKAHNALATAVERLEQRP